MPKKRFAIVGTGGRASTFINGILKRHPGDSELAALCDTSQVRMDFYNTRLKADHGAGPFPTYKADQFAQMVREQNPDAVIVTTVDAFHHEYITQTLRLGKEAITEKPMTIDAAKTRAILDAQRETGGNVRVTFNYRWMPWCTKVKQLLADGHIGNIKSVNLEYLLDTSHGADYYRRWHSSMAMCGGLLVHKSTHHFDLVNWWIDAIPERVFAFGHLVFYGKQNALARGDDAFTKYPRYTGHPEARNDPFKIELDKDLNLNGLYHQAEAETGYLRDQNVFRDGIDIYDMMSVNVKYRTGVVLTYSLNSYSPREGMRVTFNGDRGRLEFYELGGSHIIRGQSDEELAAEQQANHGDYHITLFPHFKDRWSISEVEQVAGGHGGSDQLLGEQIFSANPPAELLGRNAGHEQGAASILIGIAANTSIQEQRPINIADLVPLNPEATRLSELV